MFDALTSFITKHQVWLSLGGRTVGVLLFTVVYQHVQRRMRLWLLNRRWLLLHSFLGALRGPLLLMVWGWLLHYLLPMLVSEWLKALEAYPYYMEVWKVRWLLLCTWFVLRLVNSIKHRLLASYMRTEKSDPQVVYSVARLIYVVIAVVFAFYLVRLLELKIPEIAIVVAHLGFTWVLTATALYILYLVLGELGRLLRQRNYFLSYAIVQSVRWPVMLLSTAVGIYFSLQYEDIPLDLPYRPSLGEMFTVVLFWGIYRIITLLEEHFAKHASKKGYLDKGMVQSGGKVVRVVLVVTGILLLLGRHGGLAAQLVTWVGGSTFLVVLGAQQLIGNYVSGLVVQLEEPFKVGDWIYTTDGKLEGTVEHIGVRTTAIRTFDKRLLHVPNSILASQSFVNASEMTHRRICKTIALGRAHHDIIEQITQQIRIMLHNHPGIDNTQRVMVHLLGLDAYSLPIEIYAYTKTKDWHTYRNIQQDILLKAIKVIEMYGGSLAFPTQEVHLLQSTHRAEHEWVG